MTNGWVDIKNTDMMLIMGGNPAENHPCGFKWPIEAKRTRNAKMIVVDPRFTRTASVAELFCQIRAGADIASYDVPKFYPYGFTSAAHAIPPEESWNLDFSWEHQVRGSDLSWKVSPFARKTRNEDINVILDPTTNFVSAIPALASNIQGVELLLRKGDFNRNGFADVSIDEIMGAAGLTRGGFYKHFESRDDLVTEALGAAFKSLDVWEARAENLAQAVRDYLSEAHRDAPGKGCALGALLGDVGRSNEATRDVFTERVKHNLAFSEGLLNIKDPAERRARAMLQLSACLGAIGLARAVSDPVLSKEILDGVAGQLIPLLPGPPA